MDQIGDNNDDRNRLDEIALKEAIIWLDDREKNILRLRFAVKHRLRSLRKSASVRRRCHGLKKAFSGK